MSKIEFDGQLARQEFHKRKAGCPSDDAHSFEQGAKWQFERDQRQLVLLKEQYAIEKLNDQTPMKLRVAEGRIKELEIELAQLTTELGGFDSIANRRRREEYAQELRDMSDDELDAVLEMNELKEQNVRLKAEITRLQDTPRVKHMQEAHEENDKLREGLDLCVYYMRNSPFVDKQAISVIEAHAAKALTGTYEGE